MTRRITRCWESPTNEDTQWFMVGKTPAGGSASACWTVGRIEMLTLSWVAGPGPEEFQRYANSRVDIYDDDDKLRVSLPTSAVAVEYADSEGTE